MKTGPGLLIAVALITTACGRADPPTQAPSSTTADRPAQQTATAGTPLLAWLECEECEAGELDAVVRLGEAAVPDLGTTLEKGPPPASQEGLRRHLIDSYAEMRKYKQRYCKAPEPSADDCKLAVSQKEYETMYLDNYDAQYKIRSARALGAIGGPEARKFLEEAVRRSEAREDVRDAIAAALKQTTERRSSDQPR